MSKESTQLNAESIINLLNDLEDRFPVSEWRINDLQIWPVIRSELYYRLSVKLVSPQYNPKSSNTSHFKTVIKSLFSFLKASILDRKKTVTKLSYSQIVFLADGLSSTKIGSLYYDKFCDPLVSNLQKSSVKFVKLVPGRAYLTPRYFPSKFIQPFLDKRLISARLRRPVIQDQHTPELGEFQEYIAANTNLDFNITIDFLRKKANNIKSMQSYFSRLLKKIQPKLAFVVCYYGEIAYAYIAACKQHKIPVVDIQHGVQGSLHAAYGSWHNVPISGYQLLPNFFWCWSNFEKEVILKWAYRTKTHYPIIGGNSFLDAWKNKLIPQSNYYSEMFSNINRMLNGKKTVLFTFQYCFTDEADLRELLKAIKNTQHINNWFIRLHPLMLNEIETIKILFRRFDIKNYNIEEATYAPLYAVLQHVDVHITHSSSTVIEAASFGICSILIDDYGKALFKEQISAGWAVEAIKSRAIIKAIETTEKRTSENDVHKNQLSLALNQLLSSANIPLSDVHINTNL